MLKVGSLFAGIGGICQAFIQTGNKVIWANEIDKNACITYRNNFSHTLYEGDINDYINDDLFDRFNFPYVDILTAGFPCQAFSIAGYQKDFNDKRGNLFFSIMKITEMIRPKVLFLENVKNLKSHDNGRTLKIIKENIENQGYTYTDFVLNTMEYGNIPQNRERIYIIYFDKKNEDLNINQYSDEELKILLRIKKIKLDKTIHDLLEKEKQQDNFYYTEKSPYFIQMNEQIKNKDTVYQWRRVYIRENQSNVCPTLTANMGTGGHNVPLIRDDYGIRKLTPRECLRFQGFDDNFKLPKNIARSHLYKQAGNSVSIPVVEKLAKNINKIVLHKNKVNQGVLSSQSI